MNTSRRRELAGFFLVISFLCYLFSDIFSFLFFRKYYYSATFVFSWIPIIILAAGTITLGFYCFAPLSKKSSQLAYRLGLSIFALLYLYYIIDSIAGTIAFLELFILAIVVIMAAKTTYSYHWRTALKILFIIYGLGRVAISILRILSHTHRWELSYLFSDVMYGAYEIAEFFAFWLLWRTVSAENCDNTYPPKKLLASLKKQYDNGEISEEEYSQRKNEILSKL